MFSLHPAIVSTTMLLSLEMCSSLPHAASMEVSPFLPWGWEIRIDLIQWPLHTWFSHKMTLNLTGCSTQFCLVHTIILHQDSYDGYIFWGVSKKLPWRRCVKAGSDVAVDRRCLESVAGWCWAEGGLDIPPSEDRNYTTSPVPYRAKSSFAPAHRHRKRTRPPDCGFVYNQCVKRNNHIFIFFASCWVTLLKRFCFSFQTPLD